MPNDLITSSLVLGPWSAVCSSHGKAVCEKLCTCISPRCVPNTNKKHKTRCDVLQLPASEGRRRTAWSHDELLWAHMHPRHRLAVCEADDG